MASEITASEETAGKLSYAKRALLLVIAPAVVAGFFSLLPTVYSEITRPSAELSYTLVSGPAIPVPDGYRRIFGIAVQNTGKVSLTHIDVELSTSTGKIEDIEADRSPLHPTVSQNPPTITVGRMLPGDRTNISVMTLSNSSEPALNVSARSDEVVATEQKPEQKLDTENSLMFAGAALSAASVASMSIIFFLLVRKRGLRMIRSERPDIITFIAGVSGVVPMTETILMTEHDVSYARLADIFLIGGLEESGDRRDRCIAGLQSLLTLRNVASRSIARVRHNLSALGVEYKDAEFDSLRKKARDEEGECPNFCV